MLDTEDGIDNHPVYGSLKQIQLYVILIIRLQFEKYFYFTRQSQKPDGLPLSDDVLYVDKNIPAFYENLE